jgi:cytochrome c2
MFKRIVAGFLVLSFLLSLLVQPILAGGWTVVTLDELPLHVQAGERVQVSFQVQQHGLHPLELGAGEVTIMAYQQGSSEALRVVAESTGKPGHYTAEIVFLADGVWTWEVRPGGFPPAAMPDLTVAPGTVQPAAQNLPMPSQLGWWQQVAFQLFTSLGQPAEPSATVEAVDLITDQAAYGKALFVAKGCVTCHVHGQVATDFSVEVGPNLTTYKVIPEYVETWLKDPKAIKPAAQMPQLDLKKPEIDALIAFLSAGQQ